MLYPKPFPLTRYNMNDLVELIVAVTKVEDAVIGLQATFDKKSGADLVRFEKIEGIVEKQAITLAAHADLHTSHARLITTANDLAIEAVKRAETVRTEAQEQLKVALDNHALDTSAKLDKLAEGASDRTKLLDKIIDFQKKPLFKAAWFVGGLIGGALAAYVAAHH